MQALTAASVPARAYGWLFELVPALSAASAASPASSSSLAALSDGVGDTCLLITDSYARLLQVVLALTALMVLYIKRKLETPMRPLRVWALDVGKQCCGAFLVHCLSIALSIVFVAAAARGDDECGLYFVTYMLDTTFGVVVLLAVLQLEHALAEKMAWTDLVESGFYGDPPRVRVWANQALAYAGAVVVMKLVDAAIILWHYDALAAFATALFRSFSRHRHLELLLVMIIIPGCGNSFQFWIVDSYLKCDGAHWKYFAALVTSDDETAVAVTPLHDHREAEAAAKPVVSYDAASESTPLTGVAAKTTATRPGAVLA